MNDNEERHNKRNAVHAELRDVTRADHDAVDAAFARYNLTILADYGAFLSAHARVLPGLETELAPAGLLEDWVGRTDALLSDLEALQVAVPSAVRVELPTGRGARWGALYVLEGSRLGGAFLAKRVGRDFPVAFLSASHASGDWQRILRTIEDAAEDSGWMEEAVLGAKAVFAAYGVAANQN